MDASLEDVGSCAHFPVDEISREVIPAAKGGCC